MKRRPATAETYMTVKQVAAWLQLKPKTILRLVQRGKIPAYKIGRVWRFSSADLNEWLERVRQKGPAH